MKERKFIAAVFLAVSMTIPSASAKTLPIDIMINGNYIKTDREPIMADGTVMAPVRAVAEAMGADRIEWREDEKSAVISFEEESIKIISGDNKGFVNGEKKPMSQAARLIEGRMYAPVRFIAENMGAAVGWDQKAATVTITADGHRVDEENVDNSYTADDLKWLARIVHAEAQGESMKGKIGVANVVLNRVKSREFPNSIYDVVFDTKYGVQFTPVANGAIHNEAGKDSYTAAKAALNGENTVGESLYFCNPSISTNFWIMNNRQYYMTIGAHQFYL